MRFIWYEVQNVEDKDAISLFTRLNIGRIPLTNAELVKALFLCRKEDNVEAEKWQQEIALQWDTIERELHDEDFWNFLTRERSDNYSSRIDLIFHFMVPKDERTQDLLLLQYQERFTRVLEGSLEVLLSPKRVV